MANIRSQTSKCEACVSIKKKGKCLHKTLSKFTKGRENLDSILSNQGPFLNKTRLGFKSSISYSKGFNRKKFNHPIYKFFFCDKLGHIEPFFNDKLRRYKGINPRSLRTTNIT